jgi:hypothetical protein
MFHADNLLTFTGSSFGVKKSFTVVPNKNKRTEPEILIFTSEHILTAKQINIIMYANKLNNNNRTTI